MDSTRCGETLLWSSGHRGHKVQQMVISHSDAVVSFTRCQETPAPTPLHQQQPELFTQRRLVHRTRHRSNLQLLVAYPSQVSACLRSAFLLNTGCKEWWFLSPQPSCQLRPVCRPLTVSSADHFLQQNCSSGWNVLLYEKTAEIGVLLQFLKLWSPSSSNSRERH